MSEMIIKEESLTRLFDVVREKFKWAILSLELVNMKKEEVIRLPLHYDSYLI